MENNGIDSNDIKQLLKNIKEVEDSRLIEKYPEDYKKYLETQENINNCAKRISELRREETIKNTYIDKKDYDSIQKFKLAQIKRDIDVLKIQKEITALELQQKKYYSILKFKNKYVAEKQKIDPLNRSRFSNESQMISDKIDLEDVQFDLDITSLEVNKILYEKELGIITTEEFNDKQSKYLDELKILKLDLETKTSFFKKSKKLYNFSVIEILKRDSIIEDDYYKILREKNEKNENIDEELSKLMMQDTIKNKKVK